MVNIDLESQDWLNRGLQTQTENANTISFTNGCHDKIKHS